MGGIFEKVQQLGCIAYPFRYNIFWVCDDVNYDHLEVGKSDWEVPIGWQEGGICGKGQYCVFLY